MLTLLEIGDLSLDRFRGILRLGYQGDAWLEVRCRVQANPLSHNPNLLPSSTLPLLTPLLASQPLLVPMTLRLSRLHLRAILILVISASKGITLVFKNDPLQNVDVSSTFDSVEVIRGYLQQEIEGQLREMFREDLPGIIHRLSQRWFTGTGMGGKVELPYKDPEYAPSASGQDEDEADLNEDTPPPYNSSPSNANLTPRRRAIQKAARERRLSTAASESPTSYTVFHDIEDYDPTYGLRPEGLPTHSGYEAFGRLWEKAREGEGRGLGGLMAPSHLGDVNEHRGDVSDSVWDDAETRSFNMVEIEDSLRPMDPGQLSRPTSGQRSVTDVDDSVEWETFPAVGGGLVTRPRVYHSQSQIRAPSEVGGGAIPSPSGTATGGSVTARASSVGGASSSMAVSASFLLRLALNRPDTQDAPPASANELTASIKHCWSWTIESPSSRHQSIRRLHHPPLSAGSLRDLRRASNSEVLSYPAFSPITQTISYGSIFLGSPYVRIQLGDGQRSHSVWYHVDSGLLATPFFQIYVGPIQNSSP